MMFRCVCIGWSVGLLLFGTASAASAKPPADAAPGTSIEMPYLIAPLTVGDSLVAYAYISCKIISSSQATAIDVRDRIPFIQDAFVRDVNGVSISGGGDPPTIDANSLSARLLADAKKVMGPGKVLSLQLIQVQITPLRPGVSVAPGSPS